ncbi:hypothetical protein [Terrisporobacter mayombei]|uniref:Uncharacterized protein n=1 Tax=Terrisporobacter mayombei TaxID=1541 RepID=A0ABY9Q499_9FIRM|nr:hypothetical protein [Terrisporobacter mayombei]MCC3869059.1 hypothetical protein [Terrisporobacter mayombei]WMT82807.1 hypothetical protein TEMA_32990 [Terrisporobacter mayombei]
MKNKKELKKICIAVITFTVVSTGVSYPMNNKINALEQEKTKLTETKPQYKGDCYDETMDLSDDIVIKIIGKMDSSLDINFVNKFDEIDENNKPYSSIELSVSGNLDKIKGIESVLNDLNLNYKIEKMDIKNAKDEKGNEKNYVDCIMTFKVI